MGRVELPASDQLRRIFVDSVCLWPPALRLALEVFGGDRVMFGTDEPFWPSADSIAVVEHVDRDELELERIYRENAEQTLGPLVPACGRSTPA